MKENIQNKLKRYSIAAGAVALATQGADAQIVHTDHTPDLVLSGVGNNMTFDLNNDATDDFNFAMSSWGSSSGPLYCWPYNNNGVITTAPGSVFSYDVANLNQNDPIDPVPSGSSQTWSGGFMAVNNGGSMYGPFNNANDKFIGMRVVIAGDTLYGWAKVSVNMATYTLTIKESAYNSTPKQSILAGQTVTGIEESQYASGTNVFVNANNEVVVRRTNGAQNAKGTVTIIDAQGGIVSSVGLSGSETILGADDLASGLFIVKVTYDDGIVSRKVLVN